jgi:predicted transposase YdaD
LNGIYERRYRNGDVYHWFRYDVLRIWEQPVEEILAAGLPILPLAPMAKVGPERVASVLAAISGRFVRETSLDQAATLWAATRVLLGLRYSREQVEALTRGVSTMVLGIRGIEESSVYQDIFAKGAASGRDDGRIEEARTVLLRLGRRKLGPVSEAVEARVTALVDLDRLNDLLDRIFDVTTWDDLLAE